jgi:quercetin dioxygenase-like cupin family protein
MAVIRSSEIKVDSNPPGRRGLPLVNASVGAKSLRVGISTFQPGVRIPLHRHNVEEAIVIIDGEASCRVEDEHYTLHPYDTVHVPAGTKHHFWNASDQPFTFVSIYPANEVERHVLE